MLTANFITRQETSVFIFVTVDNCYITFPDNGGYVSRCYILAFSPDTCLLFNILVLIPNTRTLDTLKVIFRQANGWSERNGID